MAVPNTWGQHTQGASVRHCAAARPAMRLTIRSGRPRRRAWLLRRQVQQAQERMARATRVRAAAATAAPPPCPRPWQSTAPPPQLAGRPPLKQPLPPRSTQQLLRTTQRQGRQKLRRPRRSAMPSTMPSGGARAACPPTSPCWWRPLCPARSWLVGWICAARASAPMHCPPVREKVRRGLGGHGSDGDTGWGQRVEESCSARTGMPSHQVCTAPNTHPHLPLAARRRGAPGAAAVRAAPRARGPVASIGWVGPGWDWDWGPPADNGFASGAACACVVVHLPPTLLPTSPAPTRAQAR